MKRCIYIFFFNDTATTEIYTLSLHDALPILGPLRYAADLDSVELRECWGCRFSAPGYLDATPWTLGDTEEDAGAECRSVRSEEHTSELPVTPISRMPSSA